MRPCTETCPAFRFAPAPRAIARGTGSGSDRVSIEGYERLAEAARWVADYRAGAAA